MTHEHIEGGEADDGPEHDEALPDATSIPVADDPDELDPFEHPEEWD